MVTVTVNRAHLTARMNRGKELACAAVAEAVLNDSRPYTPHARMNRGKELACAAVAEAVLNDSRPYTPHDQGTLEDSGKVEKVDGEYAVTWNTVYAAYQWYGCWADGSHVIKNHDRSINAKATTQWAEAAKQEYGKSWQQIADKKMKEGSG